MYLDTAILVKLLVREPDSLFYADVVDGQVDVCSSQLILTEAWAALCRKEREGVIGAGDRVAAWAACERYVRDGALRLEPVTEAILRRANHVIERCHPAVALRSVDAIHLATAEFRGSWPVVTNDRCMRAACELLHIPVGPVPGPATPRRR